MHGSAAGSVITEDVPADALAIARPRQENKEGYAARQRERLSSQSPASSHREPMTLPTPGHWLERGPQKRLMVFSGRSHTTLAQRIAEQLGVELGGIELDTFPNGETYCRYDESIRGADLFLVQTGCEPVDQNVMELLFMIQAAKLASAKRITAVIPWFPYARQDRKAKPREPISARLIADMLQLAGADRVLTMDLHAGQIQGFFTIPVDHMTSLPLFARHFRDLGLSGEGVVSVAPDAGRAKHAVSVRRDGRRGLRDHAQAAPRAPRSLRHRGHRQGARQDRDHRRRRHDHRQHLDRGLGGAEGARRRGGLRLRDPRAAVARGLAEDRERRPRAGS